MKQSLSVNFNDNRIVSSEGEYIPTFEHGMYEMKANYEGRLVNYPENDLLFHVFVDGIDTKSSFLVSSDSEWAKLFRQRNDVKVVLEPNHDMEERSCNITFTHNTAQDVCCIIYITQEGERYDINLCDGNDCDTDEVIFPKLIGKYNKTLSVNCIGGTSKFKIFKPKKFINSFVDDIQIVKRVAFDGAINVKRVNDNQIEISTNGALSSIYTKGEELDTYVYDNNCYYVVTVSHSDMIGLTDSVKVSFKNTDEANLPQLTTSTDETGACEEIILLPPKITNPPEEDIIPSIEFVDPRTDEELFVDDSTIYYDVRVRTEPQESLVYFTYFGDYIEDVKITHDGELSTVSIKMKRNPYSFERKCTGYIINAEYPTVKIRIHITQDGNC